MTSHPGVGSCTPLRPSCPDPTGTAFSCLWGGPHALCPARMLPLPVQPAARPPLQLQHDACSPTALTPLASLGPHWGSTESPRPSASPPSPCTLQLRGTDSPHLSFLPGGSQLPLGLGIPSKSTQPLLSKPAGSPDQVPVLPTQPSPPGGCEQGQVVSVPDRGSAGHLVVLTRVLRRTCWCLRAQGLLKSQQLPNT